MNVGFYLNHLSDDEVVKGLCEEIYAGLQSGAIKDAAVFFDNAAPCRFNIPCATYNSCDMWSFEGSLVVSNQAACAKASSIVNNTNIYYYYGLEEIQPIHLLTMKKVNVICNSDESYREFKRLTNSEPKGISDNYKGIIKVLQ